MSLSNHEYYAKVTPNSLKKNFKMKNFNFKKVKKNLDRWSIVLSKDTDGMFIHPQGGDWEELGSSIHRSMQNSGLVPHSESFKDYCIDTGSTTYAECTLDFLGIDYKKLVK